MSGITSIRSRKTYSVEKTLAVLDDLRNAIKAGEIVAFAATGIDPENRCHRWTAATRIVPPLMMTGAIATLQHHYIADTEDV